MSVSEREAFWKALAKAYPDPQCELIWKTPFDLVMAIILSAQSTDKNVNRVMQKLRPVASTPAEIVALGEEGIKVFTKHINYYNNKTKAIVALAKTLLENYHGEMPRDFDTLITLPGIGRKTANVFLNVLEGAPTIGVDTHVFRLCHRLKICTGKTPAQIEAKLNRLVPDEIKSSVCLALVLHGRYICTARKPLCDRCPLWHVCQADERKEKCGVGSDL